MHGRGTGDEARGVEREEYHERALGDANKPSIVLPQTTYLPTTYLRFVTNDQLWIITVRKDQASAQYPYYPLNQNSTGCEPLRSGYPPSLARSLIHSLFCRDVLPLDTWILVGIVRGGGGMVVGCVLDRFGCVGLSTTRSLAHALVRFLLSFSCLLVVRLYADSVGASNYFVSSFSVLLQADLSSFTPAAFLVSAAPVVAMDTIILSVALLLSASLFVHPLFCMALAELDSGSFLLTFLSSGLSCLSVTLKHSILAWKRAAYRRGGFGWEGGRPPWSVEGGRTC